MYMYKFVLQIRRGIVENFLFYNEGSGEMAKWIFNVSVNHQNLYCSTTPILLAAK